MFMAKPPHSTFKRLQDAAADFGIDSIVDIATVVGESPQVLNNWRVRGISEPAKGKVAVLFEIPIAELEPAGLEGLVKPKRRRPPSPGLLADEQQGYAPPPARRWPFPRISEDQVHTLPEQDLYRIEGALALAIAQLKLKVAIADASTPSILATIDEMNLLTETGDFAKIPVPGEEKAR
jgi:hypothetical protein